MMMESSRLQEAACRRESLLEHLPNDTVVWVASGEEVIRNRDVEYEFRAHSDFHYLTGFEEPDCLLCLKKTSETVESILFLREKDPVQETWQGRRLGVEKAPQTLGLDKAFSIEAVDEKAVEILENIQHIYFSFNDLAYWSPMLVNWTQALKAKARQGVSGANHFADLDCVLHEMRLIKSPQEIELMRQAAQISVKGHLAAMEMTRPGKFEYQIQSALEHAFKLNASPRVAFSSIAASGDNACILHYTENRDQIEEGQLLLVDAGAEYAGYAGDITTTFPVSGKFSEPQAALYALVLKAQQAAIQKVKPGLPYDALHDVTSEIITQGLLALGILQGDLTELIEEKAYKAFFMHGTGHWLGRDVHDVGRYKINGEWRALEAGMVLTIEPGIYIAPDDETLDAKWRGIGIRIEDDVLVTQDGFEVLTLGLPRSVEEIEKWMHNRD